MTVPLVTSLTEVSEKKMARKTVFIPNKSFHDFSPAEEFGDIVFVTEGVISRLNVAQLEAAASVAMRQANHDDYIVVSSLPVLVAIMTGIMASRFQQVNFLLFRHGGYIPKTVEF